MRSCVKLCCEETADFPQLAAQPWGIQNPPGAKEAGLCHESQGNKLE